MQQVEDEFGQQYGFFAKQTFHGGYKSKISKQTNPGGQPTNLNQKIFQHQII